RGAALGVPLRRAGTRQAYGAVLRESGWRGIVIDLATPSRRLEHLQVSLLGSHQAGNAAVAVGVLDTIGEDGARRGLPVGIDDDALREGFSKVQWPGRL